MKNTLTILVAWMTLIACQQSSNLRTQQFEKIGVDQSGISFNNQIIENDTLNYYTFPYMYMGGGVAVGDINNDGLSDIFFTGNATENRLYLNKGNLKFEDISTSAGVLGDERWYTGVTMLDVNHDGWLDIYLSVSGIYQKPVNQLLVNNKNNTFTEQAAIYGLADATASIQATPIDFDQDGLLDLFVANYPQVNVSQGNRYYYDLMKENLPQNSGHLYKNTGKGKFEDVTAEAGVQNFGLTLGLVAADLNNDGNTDLYLSNDFNVPDYFYLNQGDGTFQEVLKESTGHTAMFGMGLDAVDFNNDGWVDLAQVDMTPSDHKRSKTNMASMRPESFFQGVEMGFHYQYMQNAIQLNNGNRGNTPFFSDVSRIAGMATTDWSWSVLFADFTNNGERDAFITNGILRDVNNNDVNVQFDNASFFGSAFDYTQLPSTPLSNYVFENQGDLEFTDQTVNWGLDEKGFSNGMAYADLDNDGDLDLIINNINSPASIYQNNNISNQTYLKIKLVGPPRNPLGIGARVSIVTRNKTQFTEQTLTRGFQSSVDPILHFGLGTTDRAEQIKVRWPDGIVSELTNQASNQLIEVFYEGNKLDQTSIVSSQLEKKIAEIPFRHTEDEFDDFINEPLLPHRNSEFGPGVSIGDVNGDGRSDIFIGNAKGGVAKMLTAKEDGYESLSGPWELDSLYEDTGSILSDLDGDGDLDLYVVSGGNDPTLGNKWYQDRLYVNVDGQFEKSNNLPAPATSGEVVLPMDFDEDGDLDLYLGGRIQPGQYPYPPNSFFLENRGGTDTDLNYILVSTDVMSPLSNIGLVTAADWVDLDENGENELIVTGEWMAINVFSYQNGAFVDRTDEFGLTQTNGWWRALKVLDIDSDGDLDIVAGNLGLNYKYKTGQERPFSVYATDFDENGTSDIVLSYEKKGKKLPLRGRECSSQQVPAIARRFETYESFADASLEEIYGDFMLESSLQYTAHTFASKVFINEGGTFRAVDLPRMAQLSTIEDILSVDFNNDERPDLLIAGNLLGSEVETPRNDASVGLILENKGDGVFEAVSPTKSGLIVTGEVRSLDRLDGDKVLITRNDDTPLIWLFK
ncbi:MAG: VCBS repeat-containing protein [Cyclobacteriaceae bacterium]